MSKKIFIKTFGCQMNEYDSNRILDVVKIIGFEKTNVIEDSNCFILNTCHIRDKAKEKVYHEIGRLKKKFKNKRKPIGAVIINIGIITQPRYFAKYSIPVITDIFDVVNKRSSADI